ncbi:MAG: hypothetical protein GF388_02460 [Candidatus Aegiribacteria sp.]|nr:hypothetical protein [Candidatus Aegiribacteria sp.]
MNRPKRQYDEFGETFYEYKGFRISKGSYRKQINGYSDWDGVTFPDCWYAKNLKNGNYSFRGSTLKECIEEIDAREERRKK